MPARIRSNGPSGRFEVLHRIGDRAGRRDRVPVGPIGLEQDRAFDADRERIAQLVGGLGRPERQHDRLSAVRIDQPDGLLDSAFLVRTDDEAEVARVDRPGVIGEDDPASGGRNALDEDEDAHACGQLRIRSLSGSNSGVAPATATVTG